jgi:hypothetical protein
MTFARDQDCPRLEALVALIAHSSIVIAEQRDPPARFLVGFEDVDIAVLNWIAGERRRLGAILVM